MQVNGKVRGHIRVPLGTGKEELERLALANEKAKPFLEGKANRQIDCDPGSARQHRRQVNRVSGLEKARRPRTSTT